MINPHDSIRCMNVLSRMYQFHYLDMSDVMKDFIEDATQLGTYRGPMFYALHNIPQDEVMLGEFFLPLEEPVADAGDELTFHSYYSIENLLGISILGQFETNTEVAYRLLIDYMTEHNLRQNTPFYHIFNVDDTMQQVSIKVGGTAEQRSIEDVWK